MNNSNTQVEYKISQAGHKEDGSNNTPETLNGTANLAAAGNPATHSTTGAPVKHESEEHASPWLFYGFSMFAFLLIVIFAINATKKMQMIPKKSQNIGEMIIEALYGLPTMVMGERGKKYAPFISTFFLYIVIMNLSGLIP
ncbi:MAG: F0F1 ATP synthase subunit A, partial [bacterium]